MLPEAKECKQCGWDTAADAPPSIDPGDRKARIGVAAGLLVAYGVMLSLVRAAPVEQVSAAERIPPPVVAEAALPQVVEPAVSMGTLPAVIALKPAPTSAPISIKVADTKSSTV